MKSLVKKSMMLLAGILMLTAACNQLPIAEETGMGTGTEKGTVVLKLTDAPFPVSLVDKAMVTIDKIEIRSTDTLTTTGEESGKDSQYIVISDEVQEFNLLDLRNGITADLLSIEIGPGSYDLIRMHVIAAKVLLRDGTEFEMKIPGALKSGLKIKLAPELVVESGVVNEILVDFDVSKSFMVQGNMKSKHGIKGFMFKPVIRAMVEKHSGRIEGKVFESDKISIEEAHVQILRADTVFSSALTDKKGNYTMIGIPAGTYQMICEKEGYTTVQVDAIIIKAKEKTVQDFILTK